MKRIIFLLIVVLLLAGCKNKKNKSNNAFEDWNPAPFTPISTEVKEYSDHKEHNEVEIHRSYKIEENLDFDLSNTFPLNAVHEIIDDLYFYTCMHEDTIAYLYGTDNSIIKLPPYLKLKAFGYDVYKDVKCAFVLIPKSFWQDAGTHFAYIPVSKLLDYEPPFSRYYFGSIEDYLSHCEWNAYLDDRYIVSFNNGFRMLLAERGAGIFGNYEIENKDGEIKIKTYAHPESAGDDNSPNNENTEVDYIVKEMTLNTMTLLTEDGETMYLYNNFNLYEYDNHPDRYNSMKNPIVYSVDFNKLLAYMNYDSKGSYFHNYDNIKYDCIVAGIYIDEYENEYNRYWNEILESIRNQENPAFEEDISTSEAISSEEISSDDVENDYEWDE